MRNQIPGMRCFLLALLDQICCKNEKTVSEIEQLLPKGIATSLSNEYPDIFDQVEIPKSNYREIDEFFKNYTGCTDSCERKYGIRQSNGFALLIAFALNELY